MLTVNYTHNNLRRTIEDMGVLVNGSEEYKYVNPGEGIAETMNPSGLTPVVQHAEAEAAVRRARGFAREALLEQLVRQRELRLQPPLWQLRGPRQLGRDLRRRRRTARRRRRSSRRAASRGRAAARNRAWDLDELVWDSHGNLDVLGRLATDRPHVVKLYGSYMLPFGTQVGAFFYGGSGTPGQPHRVQRQQHPAVRGRPRQPGPDADALADRPAACRTR